MRRHGTTPVWAIVLRCIPRLSAAETRSAWSMRQTCDAMKVGCIYFTILARTTASSFGNRFFRNALPWLAICGWRFVGASS